MNRKFLLILTLIASPVVLAKDVTVYRWVDENGVLHYSQHHPIKNEYSEVTIDTTYSPVQAPIKEGSKENPEDIDELATELAQNSQIKCKNAQANLRVLTDFDKVQMSTADGKSTTLNETEKQQRLRLNEKAVEIYCQ